jgi:DNA replication licensing factor MCM4
MRLVHNRCNFANKQLYRLQETPGNAFWLKLKDEIPDGQTPYTVSMCAYEEMVDVIKPGDRYLLTLLKISVEITGIFRGVPVKENSRRRAIKSLFKTYVDIVHIKRVDKSRIGVDASIRGQDEYTMEYIIIV